MASSVKSGFSTINRLLGKKPKDDVPVNTTSASGFHTTTASSASPASMFSRSMSNLDTTSQYNKIVPLAAMSNAPFEQTYRITVALPRDQLYVVRVGAKTKLDQILDMTCAAKQLDRDKFHFRHPADNSQVFSNACTIGEVGLNEIRLVAIADPKTVNSFNSSDLGGLKPGNRNSYAASSSGFGRNGGSGVTPTKSLSTTSPYSSTNSLNSLESAQQLASRPAYQRQQSPSSNGPPVAPMRKKRAAPRPPSQIVIPEDSPVRQMSFHVSTPNLSQPLHINSHGGGRVVEVERHEVEVHRPFKQNGLRPVSMFQETNSNGIKSTFGGSSADLKMRPVSRTSSNASQLSNGSADPEATPRQRLSNGLAAKRKKAAPAPPPRTRESLTPTPQSLPPPVPTPRTMTPVPMERVEPRENNENISKTLLNSDVISTPSPPATVVVEDKATVSVNSQPIKEASSPPQQTVEISSPPQAAATPPAIEKVPVTPKTPPSSPVAVAMEVKQNGSPVSIAIVTSNGSVAEKENLRTQKSVEQPGSSDEDDGHRMNIYNLNSQKSIQAEIVAENGQKSTEAAEINLEEIQGMILDQINGNSGDVRASVAIEEHVNQPTAAVVEDLYAEVKKPQKRIEDQLRINGNGGQADGRDQQRSDSPLWTYTLPAPPHFADGNNNNLLMAVNGALVNGNGLAGGGLSKIPQSPETAGPAETFNSSVYYNYAELEGDGESIGTQSMTTTVVSDVLITPVIKERIPMLDQPLMLPLADHNHFHNDSESSDFNSSSTLTSASPNNLHGGGRALGDELEEDGEAQRRKKLIINSDNEDGYHGRTTAAAASVSPNERLLANEGLIKTLEKRRQKFIENELEQLVKGGGGGGVIQEDLMARHQMDISSTTTGIGRRGSHEDVLIENNNNAKKANGMERENEEPKISTSPVEEDGLPAQQARTFIRRQVSKGMNGGGGLRGVQRSDSFHSTRIEEDHEKGDGGGEKLKMNGKEISSADRSSSHVNLAEQSFEQRRSSFLQEMENTKNLFNRRTSSELSISDAPSSLQSLEVMKSILLTATRRSSKEGQEEEGNKAENGVEVVKREIQREVKEEVQQPVAVKPSETPQPGPVPKEAEREVKPESEMKPQVESKPWVYTGPPKINLGSWNERPKIQVCLKTDSDYYHSIQGAERASLSGHSSMEGGAGEQEKRASQDEAEKSGSTEAKLPVVRGMELKKSISIPAEPLKPLATPSAGPTEPVPLKSVIQRPLSMHSTRFLPLVRGFQLQARSSSGGGGGQEAVDEEVRSTRINPVLMRSDSNVVAKANGGIAGASVVQVQVVEKEKPKEVVVPEKQKEIIPTKSKEPVETVKTPPPTLDKPIMFSQSTLRRTGLKEKILSQPAEEEHEKKFVKMEEPKINLSLRPVSMAAVPPPPPTPPSTPEKVVPTSPPPPPPPMIKAGGFMNPLARLTAANVSTPANQKPVVRGVVKKAPTTSEVDPRSQLLDSIKNFNFNNLRKM